MILQLVVWLMLLHKLAKQATSFSCAMSAVQWARLILCNMPDLVISVSKGENHSAFLSLRNHLFMRIRETMTFPLANPFPTNHRRAEKSNEWEKFFLFSVRWTLLLQVNDCLTAYKKIYSLYFYQWICKRTLILIIDHKVLPYLPF